MLQLCVRRSGPEIVKERRVPQNGVLDDLRAAIPEDLLRQRRQAVRVAEHEPGLIERPGQVFPRRQIDGCLAADGRVDHGEQRRRDLDEADAAQIGRGGKARQIARHAAAERGDRVLPRQLLRAERVEKLKIGARALGALAVREHKAADCQPGSLQTAADRAAIQRPDRIVRDEHHFFRVRHGADLLAGPLQKAAPDPDLIASRCVDRYRFHRPSTSSLRFLPSSSSCVSASPSFSTMAARYCMRQSISPSSSRSI